MIPERKQQLIQEKNEEFETFGDINEISRDSERNKVEWIKWLCNFKNYSL